jgi:2-polyprenyl-3-methyl-5-hydroxy-6-metoxy-1,4-benzoquinol methylase
LVLLPFPSKANIEEYYSKHFQYTAGMQNKKRISKRSFEIVHKLMKLNPKGKTLLDIGSGLGFLLEAAKQNGLIPEGIEPSTSLALTTKNYNVYNGTFQKYVTKFPKKKFDFITLIHVIEHVKDPHVLIKDAVKKLNNNGILLIETPNINSHLYKTELESFTFLTPPDHLWIFSINSISKLFNNNSFDITATTYSYPEHLMGIIKKIIHNTPKTTNAVQTNPGNLTAKKKFTLKTIKYFIFDRFIAKLAHPVLNINYHGSILELCIRKK